MIVPLFARNFRHHRTLFAVLAAGLAGFEMLLIRAASGLETGPGFRAIFNLMPPAVRSIFESQFGVVSFASAVAFGFTHPVTLAGSIAFVVVAGSIPAAEHESKFLELILARPLARREYLVASLLLTCLGAVVLPLAMLSGAAIGMPLMEAGAKLPWTRYLPCALGLMTLLLAFGGIALFLASGAKRRGPAASQMVGIALVSFLVEVLADLWPGLGWIRWASPFHYYKPIQAAIGPSTPWQNPAILLAIFAVATALAFWRFSRRDA